jgi:pyruvyl transferase EpsO
MESKNKQILYNLRNRIENTILPLISSDYVLWGLPYYVNPGDTFIWEGTLDLLKKCPYKCVGTCGWDEYQNVPLNKETVILIMGGGYFGDLWRKAWQRVVDTITYYPENPILILPQSIYYSDPETAVEDSKRLSSCKRLTILTRDQESYDYAKHVFNFAQTLLCPDLAFHMNLKKLIQWEKQVKNNILYLKRGDSEFVAGRDESFASNAIISDWPDMTNQKSFGLHAVYYLYRICKKINGASCSKQISGSLMKHLQKRIIIKDAVRFISQFKTIYTTRLHAMILSFLLGKEIVIIDNSYGKVSGCYKTWLRGSDNISIYGE